MLFAVFLLMLVVDIKTTLFAGAYFGILGWLVLKRQQKIAQEAGRMAMELKIGIADKTFESFRIKRELSLRGLTPEYVNTMGKTKAQLKAINARIILFQLKPDTSSNSASYSEPYSFVDFSSYNVMPLMHLEELPFSSCRNSHRTSDSSRSK
jgi:hypothetical protein